MQVSVEKVNNVERRLTIVVPADQVEDAYTKQINEMAKKANIKGFRPGKAPLSYIQERFGADARNEALNEIMQKTLFQAISEQNLKPISMPRVEPKNAAANEPLEFVASFEVLPEIENINLKMDSIERLVVNLTDEDFKRVLEQLQKQFTQWKLVERPAIEKDRVVIDYYAIFDGKSDIENKIQNFPLELGSKVMMPGFEDALIGVKPGDERTIQLTFPADFAVEDKAGKPVEFIVNVHQIFEAEVSDFTEDFIQRLGIKSGQLADLQNQIKQSLEQERDRLVKENLKEKIFSQLVEQNPVEVPNSLIESEAKSIHDEVYQNQQHDHHGHSHDELANFNDIAKKRVALSLLIGAYAKQMDLHPDAERVNQRIQEIAAAYENPKEVASYLSSPERKSGIESQILEDMVLEKLLETIPATEKIISYADLKGIRI